jgi:ABC-type lipoprotein release transport system permease subunit
VESKVLLKLALRNIIGAGFRTWLTVLSLSFSFVVIIFLQGLYSGMNQQMEVATVDAEYGGGHYWQENYDPFDAQSLDKAHGVIPPKLADLITKEQAIPILVQSATIYPKGRIKNVLLKGIPQKQKILSIPSYLLHSEEDESDVGALIGRRMAKASNLQKGDFVTLRWRDVNGSFDAIEIKIKGVMDSDVATIDSGIIWIDYAIMQKLMLMAKEASLVVLAKDSSFSEDIEKWNYKSLYFLKTDIRSLYLTKSIGGSIFYIILLLLALLAVYDTQVLAIFHKKREIGTMMALGMSHAKIITLFTLQGAIHSVLAALVGAIYGIPLLTYMAKTGFGLPTSTDDFGYSLGSRIFPIYSLVLVITTIMIVLIATAIVSYLPTLKLTNLKATDALRAKIN